MTRPLVWLPFDPARLGQVPDGLRYETVEPGADVPDRIDEVEFYVPWYGTTAAVGELLPRMTALRVVQLLSAGVDNVRDTVPQGVVLCSGRGIHETSTAELVLSLILASLRGIPEFVRAQDRHEWVQQWRPALADRRVLVVGYGAVGAAIESRILPFEAEVVRVARHARAGVQAADELPRLLPDADVVVVVVPLTTESRGLVDAGFLAAMKDGALLVNVARGPVVDTDALVAELATGRIRAAVDVTDPEPLPSGHPLWKSPNLLISPHVGGATTAMWPRAYRLVREQLWRFANGEELVNVVTGEY